MIRTRRWEIDREQSIRDLNGTNQGNGNDRHMPLGRASNPQDPTIYRMLVRYAQQWGGVGRIIRAREWRRTTDGKHLSYGGNPSVDAERISAAWGRGGGSEGSWGANAPTVFPGPAVTGPASTRSHNAAKRKWRSHDVTEIVEAHAPASVQKRDGSPGDAAANHGHRLKATDESTGDDKVEYNGSRAATARRRPYIELTYDDNRAPNVPAELAPVTGSDGSAADTASARADRVTVTGTFSDPDPGDRMGRLEAAVHADSATDGSPGTPLHTTVLEGEPESFHLTLPPEGVTSPLRPRTTYRYRVRTQDAETWGPWSSLADGRVRTVYRPGVPAHPVFEPTIDAPLIHASIVSEDPGDFITGHRVQVHEDLPTGGIILKWDSGDVSQGGAATRAEVTYQGSQLENGRTYRWRIRLVNSDGITSDWTPSQHVRPSEDVGPDAMTPLDDETLLLTRTPLMTVGHSASFDAYRARLHSTAGLRIHDTGLVEHSSSTSEQFTVPADLLDWGQAAEWEAAVRLVGETALGPYSPRRPFRVNALPAAPTIEVRA